MCAVDEIVQPNGAKDDANRADANGGPASIVTRRHSRGIIGLMKFPERLHAWMNAFPAAEHLTADTFVLDATTTGNDWACDGDRALGVVGRFCDSPFTFPVSDVTRNDGPRRPFEPSDSPRIPTRNV